MERTSGAPTQSILYHMAFDFWSTCSRSRSRTCKENPRRELGATSSLQPRGRSLPRGRPGSVNRLQPPSGGSTAAPVEVAESEAARPTEDAEAAPEGDPEATEAAVPTTKMSRRIFRHYFFLVKQKKNYKKP
jgi:hypothetical protein